MFLLSLKLVVSYLKAEDLPEAKNDYPRVYVTVNLLCNSNVSISNEDSKTNVQQGTYSPKFDESFEFDISNTNIEETFLRFIVWYVDSFSQGECLGMVEHNLDELTVGDGLTSSAPNVETVICKDIQRISRVRM